MRSTALTALQWVVGLSLLGITAGCDRLFGSGDTTDAASTVSLVPPRPVVLPIELVASVNGAPISKHDVELRIQEIKAQVQFVNPDVPWTPLTDEELEAVMDELIEAELMGQDAVTSGLLNSLETQRRWEFIRRRFFAEEWVRVQQKTMVANSEIERYYQENQLGFQEPERITLRQLSVTTPSDAQQALARFHGGAVDFATLVRELSVGPTVAQGGMIREDVMRSNEKLFVYGSEEAALAEGVISLDPVLEAAAFAIDQANGVSNYVKGPDGRYHVFQLVERQEGSQRSLNEVWDWIKQALSIEQLQQAVQEFSAEATIERHPERVWDVEQE